MKARNGWMVAAIAVALAGGGGYWLGHRGAGKAAEVPEAGGAAKEEEKPVVNVLVTALARSSISQEIQAYGTVVAPANEVQVVSVPFECRVTKMLVAPGQTVGAGQPLVQVQGSAATALALEEAKNAAAAAERDLQLIKQRYEQKLATNSELYTGENTLRTAQGRLQSLQQGGAGGAQELKAERAGIVSKVDVQIGQVVPIGGPLIEVAAQERIEVKLGVEPEDVGSISPGYPVALRGLDAAQDQGIMGSVRLIAQRVDPATRLVDVIVALPPQTHLMLDSFLTGRFMRVVNDAWVVPRDAALPSEDGGYTLYTVKDGKAVKHTVRIGVQTSRQTQVISDDLKQGDSVVVTGNYLLDDAMSVHADPAPPAAPEPSPAAAPEPSPAATQPATAEAPSTEPTSPASPQTAPAQTTGGRQ